jgi:hypothetical protein
MYLRAFFTRQSFLAVFFCPILLLLMTNVELPQPKLLKPAEYQLTPQFFKFISCGFWPAAADLLWMQTLQKVADANYSSETLPEMLGFYRLSTDLDPKFYEAYDQAAVMFSFFYEAPAAALEMIDRGIKVYESGNAPPRFWTHPYSLYLDRAYVNAFLRNDWSAAKEDYLKAAYTVGAPPYLQEMKRWLQKEGSEKRLAVKVLTLLIQNSRDPVIKAKYEEKKKHYE